MPSCLLFLTGCEQERIQSALHPAGPAAEEIAGLWWFMFWMLTVAFVIVMAVLVISLVRQARAGKPMGGGFIIAGGIIFPAVVLTIMLVYSLRTTVRLQMPETNLTIEVIGHQWWWEVRYPEQGIVTANQLHIPVGEPVRLELLAADVIHSFWVPNLHGKMDMMPEHPNTFWIQADVAGEYRGQCAEFCGVQHALMAFKVIALPREEFDQWAQRKQQPPAPPQSERLVRGREAFIGHGCSACHAVRGLPEPRDIGPDLTHIGSRLTLGAGTVPNTRGYLAGWISNPQPIKPGNNMPATHMPAEDLHVIVEYLESLR